MSASGVFIAVLYASLVVIYYVLYFRYHRLAAKEKAEASRVRWREPADFVCPVCQHRPAEHFAEKDNTYYGCGYLTGLALNMSRELCSWREVNDAPRFLVRCLCARSQESLLREAEVWSYRLPPTPVLMSYLTDDEPKGNP